MGNNIAELLPITIDNSLLKSEYDSFIEGAKDISWDWRTYVYKEQLPKYFNQVTESIIELINVTPKNYLFQVYDPRVYKEKWYLNIVHKDDDRKTCITIPVSINDLEPVMFYRDIENVDFKDYKKTNKAWPEKPEKICKYSVQHPNLVNVSKLHNVRVLDMSNPRVLFQLSFDESFQDIIKRNPDIWKVM
jgi:hypothetical protein